MGKKETRYITYNDRIKIETMYNSLKCSPKLIADTLGFHFTNIYKELKRGKCEQLDAQWRFYNAYSAKIAQDDYDLQASKKGPKGLKIGNDHALAQYIEEKIKKKYSPRAALYAIRNEGRQFSTTISHTTLYRYIDNGLFLTVTNKDLPNGKRKRRYRKLRRICYKNSLKPSIEQRPKEIEKREDFGNWEMDTVVGKAKGKSSCLLVLSERKTRAELIEKMSTKTATNVVAALNRLQYICGRDFKKTFGTITVDNGSEFDDLAGMQKEGRTEIYYCHPFSSWERGTNENANRLIRRHIPKGTPLTRISKKKIAEIQEWINDYPREIFGGKSSKMMLEEELAKLGIKNLSSFLATKG